MTVSRLGSMNGAWGDVSRFEVPWSRVAPSTASEEQLVPQRRTQVPERGISSGPFPESAMAIGKEIAWWPVGREDVAPWAGT
eukprot:737810-Alexandrium_andersonii.AAC.1